MRRKIETVDADYLSPCGRESDFGILASEAKLKCQKSQERGCLEASEYRQIPSLGFSTDLAALNPRKSFLPHKGGDNPHRRIRSSVDAHDWQGPTP